MKYFFYTIAVVILMFSCKPPETEEAIKNKIAEHEGEIEAHQKKIKELKYKLDSILGNSTEVESDEEALLVEAKKILPASFHHYVEVTGQAEAVNEAFISPEMNGQIKKVYVAEGDYVKKGQVLVSLNSDVINNSISELKTRLDLAKTMYDKQERLYNKKIGSEVQYLQAKNNYEALKSSLATAKSQLAMSQITAPISGIVDGIFQQEGEMAVPGMRLIRLVQLNEMYINADVSEKYLPYIKKGEEINISFPTYPSLKLKAPIHFVGNVIHPQNRTFIVQLKLKNMDNKIKPNLLALLQINDFSSDSALLVPSIIIKKDFNGDYLYLVHEKGGKKTARKVYVETGLSNQVNTMITNGLSSGDLVIQKGYNLVKDKTQIKLSQID